MKNDANRVAEEHHIRNVQLVTTIRRQGVDTSATRQIDLHFWSSSEQDAAALARELGLCKNFRISKESARPVQSQWSLEITCSMSVDEVVTDTFVNKMIESAESHASIFDGWGTAL